MQQLGAPDEEVHLFRLCGGRNWGWWECCKFTSLWFLLIACRHDNNKAKKSGNIQHELISIRRIKIYIYVCVCLFIYLYIFIYLFMYIFIYLYYISVCVFACTYVLCILDYISIYMCVCVLMYIYIYGRGSLGKLVWIHSFCGFTEARNTGNCRWVFSFLLYPFCRLKGRQFMARHTYHMAPNKVRRWDWHVNYEGQ